MNIPHGKMSAKQFIDWVNFNFFHEGTRNRILLAEILIKMEEKKNEKVEKTINESNLREKIRSVFLHHKSCAFRTDLNVETLDCLRYMEEDILNILIEEIKGI